MVDVGAEVLLGLVSLALLGFVDAGANIRGNHQLVLEEIKQSLQAEGLHATSVHELPRFTIPVR